MANDYFNKMNKARKEGAKSFTYNGKTYVATKTKTGMIVYKATILFTVELRDDSAKTENAQPQAQPQESTKP